MGLNTSGPDQRYWLLIGNVPSGPFTVEQIHAQLAAGDVTWQTTACPLTGNTWLPLVQVPGFGPVTAPSTHSERLIQGEFTYPANRLSLFGILVCVYCLAINPFYWFASNLACCMTGLTYKEGSPISNYEIFLTLIGIPIGISITVALAWGGDRLRRQGLVGKGLLQKALIASITYAIVSMLAILLVVVEAHASGGDNLNAESAAGTVINFFMSLMGLACFAFEIAALVWLVWLAPTWQSRDGGQNHV